MRLQKKKKEMARGSCEGKCVKSINQHDVQNELVMTVCPGAPLQGLKRPGEAKLPNRQILNSGILQPRVNTFVTHLILVTPNSSMHIYICIF